MKSDEEDENFPSKKEILQDDDIAWDGTIHINTKTDEKLCATCVDYVVSTNRASASDFVKSTVIEFCRCGGCDVIIGSE